MAFPVVILIFLLLFLHFCDGVQSLQTQAYKDNFHGKLVKLKNGFSQIFLSPMSFQKPIQKFGMDVGEVWQLKFRRKMQKGKICLKITICMNVSRFMNLAAIFSLDLES